MKPRLALLLIVLPLLSVACAFGYYARGTLSDMPGELQGKAFPGNATGGGRFVLKMVGVASAAADFLGMV